MKKYIYLILSTLFVSCLTVKNTNNNSFIHSYKIGSIRINPITRFKYEVDSQSNNTGAPNPNISSQYYLGSENGKIRANITILKHSIIRITDIGAKERFNDMKGLYGLADVGNKLLSSDYVSVGQNWIFAIESTLRGQFEDEKISILIETDKVRIGIVTDIEHRATAIGLMDAFTKELMNVKLKLK